MEDKETSVANLVYATFFGRNKELINYETGEIIDEAVKVKIIEYPDGGIELCGVVRAKRADKKSIDARELDRIESDIEKYGDEKAREMAEQRKELRSSHSSSEAARRAKTQVRMKCRVCDLSIMVTLTFPGEGIHDYNKALSLVQNFIHDHGKALYREGKWIAVPELHPNGHGWHWHILVSRRFTKKEIQTLREKWTDFLGRKGIVPSGSANYVRINIKEWRNASEAAAYAAKYVGKSFDEEVREKNRKRYLVAHGIEIKEHVGSAASIQEVREFIEKNHAAYVYDSKDDENWCAPPMVWAAFD